MDLIIGIHSIAEAIKNPSKKVYSISGTEEGFKELYKRGNVDPKQLDGIQTKKMGNHQFQEEAKQEYKQRELTYQRVPSGIFALCSPTEFSTVPEMLADIDSGKNLKIIALDQVTDTHNAGAILRTSAFYGVD